MSEHRTGINPGFLIKHTISLSGLNESNVAVITTELDHLPYVDSVCIGRDKQTIKIAYDASHHDIDEMIAIIGQHGAKIKDSWWSRTKLGWQRQVDNNIKDNSKHEPHCCSKMPRR